MVFADSSIINPSSIIAFVIGIGAGMILLLLIFAIIIASEKKKASKVTGATIDKLNEEKVKELISNKQKEFIKLVEEDEQEYIKTCTTLTMELLHEISSYYFPDSLYPEYELTIIEAANLIHYVVDQVVKQLDRPILRMCYKVKISSIANTINKSRKVKNNKMVKAAGKAAGTAGNIKTVLNMLNPVMWFNKIVVNGGYAIAIKKLIKAELAIVGRECDKVYSKSLFNKESDEEAVKKCENQDIEEIFADDKE